MAAIIFAVLLFIAGFVLTILVSGGTIEQVIDIPIPISLILFVIPIFVVSGHSKDFSKAFAVIFFKEKASLTELKKAKASFAFLNKLLFLGSSFITFIGCHAVVCNLEDLSSLFPDLAVALLPFFYAFILYFILSPFSGIINRMIIDYEN